MFGIENYKVIGKLKIETPKNIFIDDFFCLRSKAYPFICGKVNKDKLEGFSKPRSENFQF